MYSELNERIQESEVKKRSLSEKFNKEIKHLESTLFKRLGCYGSVEVERLGYVYNVSPVYISGSVTSFDKPNFNSHDDFTEIFIGFYFNNYEKIVHARVFTIDGEFIYQLFSENADTKLVRDFVDVVISELVDGVSKDIR